MEKILKTLFMALDEEQGRTPEMDAAINAAEPVFAAARDKLSCAEFDRSWTAAMNIGTADVVYAPNISLANSSPYPYAISLSVIINVSSMFVRLITEELIVIGIAIFITFDVS